MWQAVRVSQWVGDFFIQTCRDSNSRAFPSADALASALITGDAPRLTDCRGDGSQISECYYWEWHAQRRTGVRRGA